ncbi:hypothetical protein E2C01_012459 [Portunus trituberculatus]|uniref:Uncharacterized protein n=1 Tax=Portunus trituberculatus TaxID=210409 RepID=A0A5B7DE65_PORTR|nr:hypothetical protein [Portunus trituberculatus]
MASALAPRPFSQAKSLNGVCTECAFVLLLLTVEDRNIAAAAGTNWHRNGYGLGQVRSFALRGRPDTQASRGKISHLPYYLIWCCLPLPERRAPSALIRLANVAATAALETHSTVKT